jgi:hypothetical protein
MTTRLALDSQLVSQARRLGGHKTNPDAVTAVLREYIQRRRRMQIVDLMNTIEYDDDYDYKALRYRKHSP